MPPPRGSPTRKVEMANAGIAPLDATTALGTARALIGDTQYGALAPPVTGQGDYGWFSDAEILSFLAIGAQNPIMATGFAFLALAGQVAADDDNVDVQSLDFKVSASKRAGDLRATAEEWFARANNVEQASIVGTGVSKFDLRDYLYPTGNLIFSDLIWEFDSVQDGVLDFIAIDPSLNPIVWP